MTDSSAWLPNGPLFLEVGEAPVRPNRPFWSGDIFFEVPVPEAGKANAEGVPKVNVKLDKHAMLVGHPCTMYSGRNLTIRQNVVLVRPCSEAEAGRLAAPWHSDFKLLPLPGFGDGTLWVADFNRSATVNFKWLERRRVACLTPEGVAALHRRGMFHTYRIDQSLDQRTADLLPYAHEVDLWERWTVAGLEPGAFQDWLDAPPGDQPGEGARRELLGYSFDALAGEIDSLA